jgi:hypothetical protein
MGPGQIKPYPVEIAKMGFVWVFGSVALLLLVFATERTALTHLRFRSQTLVVSNLLGYVAISAIYG